MIKAKDDLLGRYEEYWLSDNWLVTPDRRTREKVESSKECDILPLPYNLIRG